MIKIILAGFCGFILGVLLVLLPDWIDVIPAWLSAIGSILSAVFACYAAVIVYRIWKNDKYLNAIDIIEQDFESKMLEKPDWQKKALRYSMTEIQEMEFDIKPHKNILNKLLAFCEDEIKPEIKKALILLKNLKHKHTQIKNSARFSDTQKFNQLAEQYREQKAKIIELLHKHIR